MNIKCQTLQSIAIGLMIASNAMAGSSLNIDSLNEQLTKAKNTVWAQDPALIVLHFFNGSSESKAVSLTIDFDSADPQSSAKLTLIKRGLLDDAQDSVRYRIELQKETTGYWLIQSAEQSHRCWPKRDNKKAVKDAEGYHSEPCL